MKRAVAGVVALAFVVAGSVFAEDLKLDAVHTQVIFKIKHMNASWQRGRFNSIDGKIAWDAKDLSRVALEFTVKADSVDTGDKKRDDHLRGPDFFNAKQFPTITFKSTKVEKKGEKYEATGDLTLHGVTKPITVPFEIVGEVDDPKMGYRIGADATFTIKRSDFDMKYGLGPLGDDVELTIGLEATRGK